MKRLRSSVRRKLKKALRDHPDDFCYAIDDTDNPKYGKKYGKYKIIINHCY